MNLLRSVSVWQKRIVCVCRVKDVMVKQNKGRRVLSMGRSESSNIWSVKHGDIFIMCNKTIVSESHLFVMYYSCDLRLVSGRVVVVCLWAF